MLIIDTGELTEEFVNSWIGDEFPFKPSVWVIEDFGENCIDIYNRYALMFLNLKDECAWGYGGKSLHVVVTEAKNMGLEGVRGAV